MQRRQASFPLDAESKRMRFKNEHHPIDETSNSLGLLGF